MLEPATAARAVWLGGSAIMVARNLGEDELNGEAVNRTWKEQRFPWMMVPVQKAGTDAAPGTAGGGDSCHVGQTRTELCYRDEWPTNCAADRSWSATRSSAY